MLSLFKRKSGESNKQEENSKEAIRGPELVAGAADKKTDGKRHGIYEVISLGPGDLLPV